MGGRTKTPGSLDIPRDEKGVELVIEHRTPTKLSSYSANLVWVVRPGSSGVSGPWAILNEILANIQGLIGS